MWCSTRSSTALSEPLAHLITRLTRTFACIHSFTHTPTLPASRYALAACVSHSGFVGPVGFRGWGGGNLEPAVVGERATSRSYLLGPMLEGNWSVVVGKPRIAVPPGRYNITVELRDTPTLSPQTERQPYTPVVALKGPSAGQALEWWAGDFHTHSRESGDAFHSASLDEMATFARERGLDFVHISDHNTVSAVDFVLDAQSRHPNTLIIPGVEFTTYYGHAGAIGTTAYVDHKLGLPGVTIQGAADAVHAQGGLFSINHFDMCVVQTVPLLCFLSGSACEQQDRAHLFFFSLMQCGTVLID